MLKWYKIISLLGKDFLLIGKEPIEMGLECASMPEDHLKNNYDFVAENESMVLFVSKIKVINGQNIGKCIPI